VFYEYSHVGVFTIFGDNSLWIFFLEWILLVIVTGADVFLKLISC